MMKYYLTVKNYTEAMRGKSYLKGLNINCNVEKVSTLNITVLKIESGKSDGLS